MYRAGIIGLGFAGMESEDSHFKAYSECVDTEIYGLCDIDVLKVDKVVSLLPHDPVKSFLWTNPLAMVKQLKPNIVSICTPVETHCQIVCDIAPYVKAINCEKPIATTLDEADIMIQVCQSYNVILQVNHQRRFAKPVMRWSRGLVNNGTHAVDLIRQLGAEGKVDLEYVDTDDYIFELDIFSDPRPARLTLKGVEHLVECLKKGKQSISSGKEARETLRQVLEYERNKSNPRK